MCLNSDDWIENKFDMSRIEEYINITVYNDRYEILGYRLNNEIEVLPHLEKAEHRFTDMGSLPPHLFLRSDKSVDCSRFQRIARLISSKYPCSGNNLCVWAYGSGAKSLPLGVSPPPAEGIFGELR